VLNPTSSLFLLSLHATMVSSSNIADDVFHQFQPNSATGMVLPTQFHLSVHPWPEGTLWRWMCTLAITWGKGARSLRRPSLQQQGQKNRDVLA
jgi:S-adenosylmethionine/arginine decarboxylase-like enzyme